MTIQLSTLYHFSYKCFVNSEE